MYKLRADSTCSQDRTLVSGAARQQFYRCSTVSPRLHSPSLLNPSFSSDHSAPSLSYCPVHMHSAQSQTWFSRATIPYNDHIWPLRWTLKGPWQSCSKKSRWFFSNFWINNYHWTSSLAARSPNIMGKLLAVTWCLLLLIILNSEVIKNPNLNVFLL